MTNDTKYFINNMWLSWEQVHNLGYTKQPPQHLQTYTSNNIVVDILKDTSDNTYYNFELQSWDSDITNLNVFVLVGTIQLYLGEDIIEYQGYSNSVNTPNITHVLYNNQIVDLSFIYNQYGITTYKCNDFIVNDGVIISWYDSNTSLYWDNRPDKKEWIDTPPKVQEDTSYGILSFPTLTYIDSTLELSSLILDPIDDTGEKEYWLSPSGDSDIRIDINGSSIVYNSNYTGIPIKYDQTKNYTLLSVKYQSTWHPEWSSYFQLVSSDSNLLTLKNIHPNSAWIIRSIKVLIS